MCFYYCNIYTPRDIERKNTTYVMKFRKEAMNTCI